MPISALQVSDIVLVRPGARVPADGVVVDGTADVDESMITGESRPVSEAGRRPGRSPAPSPPAARSGSGSPRPATQTALSGIMRLVAQAQASARGRRRSPTGPRRSCSMSPSAAGAITLVGWWLLGDPEGALVRTATVLVIACPHALGLAIPLVIAISTSLGARNGLLVKDRLALERARTLDTVIFDKTGTLTKGEPVARRRQPATTDASASCAGGRGRGRLRASPRPSHRRWRARLRGLDRPVATVASRHSRARRARPGRGPRGPRSAGPRLLADAGAGAAAGGGRTGTARAGPSCRRRRRRGAPASIAVEDEIRPESREAIDVAARARRSGWR